MKTKQAFLMVQCDPTTNGGKSFITQISNVDPRDLKPLASKDKESWMNTRRKVWSDGQNFYLVG